MMKTKGTLFFTLLYATIVFHQMPIVTSDSVNYGFGSRPERLIYEGTGGTRRLRGFQDIERADIIIGGMFAVHRPLAGSTSGQCSTDIVRSGVERIEALLYSLDRINSDPTLLPNITLGYDIRDTCVSENVALDETIQLLFSEGIDACRASVTNDAMASASSSGDSDTDEIVISSRSVNAIIGPTTSQVSLSVANLLRLFTTPGVSYSVSSPTFNNRNLYQYFYRTHPSDSQEVQAIIDLLIHFQWTYVTAIHSNNAYGDPAMDIFRELAADNDICIDLDIGLSDSFLQSDYLKVARTLLEKSNASVVVLFASAAYVEDFMEQLAIATAELKSNSGEKRSFVWIGSSSWIQANSIITEYKDLIAGSWGYEALTRTESNINEYFPQLTIQSNQRNPWFGEYYEDYYNCIIGSSCHNNTPVTSHPEYSQRDYVQLVLDAIYSVAHALDDFFEKCDRPLSWDINSQSCTSGNRTIELTGENLNGYIQNVSFLSPSGNKVQFDSNGNSKSHYTLVNNQLDYNDSVINSVEVGLWDEISNTESALTLFNNISFRFATSPCPVLSQCQQCPAGHYKVIVQSSCCGTCDGCYGNQFTNSSTNTECSLCPNGTWGNDPLKGNSYCQVIQETWVGPSDGFGILLILVALFGIICVVIVAVAMGILWKTPVIKSSGREQMTLLLVGIGLSFIVTVFFIVRPSITVCLFQRLCTWFCLSLILSALFIKLIRIARIFLRGQNAKRPRFIQSKYQVVFTFLMVSAQMLLVVISLVVVYPEAVESVILNSENTLDRPIINIQCSSPHIAVLVIQILVYSAILIATNVLAVLTVRFPENFNEARYVAFSTLSILLIWVAFLQTYFAVDETYRIAVICFTIQLTSLAVLFCLFVPRIVSMIVKPSKNKLPSKSSDGLNPYQSPITTKINVTSTSKVSALFQEKDMEFEREIEKLGMEEKSKETTKL